jgi:hypothetical protein
MDPEYKSNRSSSKRKWSGTNRQGASYQSMYRQAHPIYNETNREKQRYRVQKGEEMAEARKIVKTDAISLQVLDRQGVVFILVKQKTDGKKIVKTDAISLQVLDRRILMQMLCPDSG